MLESASEESPRTYRIDVEEGQWFIVYHSPTLHSSGNLEPDEWYFSPTPVASSDELLGVDMFLPLDGFEGASTPASTVGS
ncbi:hypothetical protein ACYOEI_01940 [Singulisphaera rosea]